MSRISVHSVPNREAIERNKKKEPEGERIRQELIDFLKRNRISTMMLDTDEHCISVDIVKLPPEIKPVLTCWGSIFIKNEPASPVAPPEKVRRNVVIYGAETGGWPCQVCGFGHAANTSCGVAQSGAGGEQYFTVSYEFLHKLWQTTGSVPQGVNQICAGVYEACRDAYTALEDLFNRPSSPSGQASAPQKERTYTGQDWKDAAELYGNALREIEIWKNRALKAENAASPTGGAEPLYSEQELRQLGLKATTTNYGAEGSATMYSPVEPAAAEPSAEQDNYIAWLRFAGPTENRYLSLCDSDSERAFKVYKWETVERHAAHVTRELRAADVKRAQDISRLTVERDEAREQLEQAQNRNTALGLEVDAWRLSGKHFKEAVGLTQQHTQEVYVARIEQLKAAEAQLSTAREALLIFGRHLTSCQWIGRDKGDKPSCECKLCDTLAALAPAKEAQGKGKLLVLQNDSDTSNVPQNPHKH